MLTAIDGSKTWEVTDAEPKTLEERSTQCKDRIEQANRNINVGFFDMASGMAESVEFDYVSMWGFPNLETYADEILGLDRRKAYNMVECGRAIRVSPLLTRERVESIGWSKLTLIARRIELSPVKAVALLELAENSSWRSLKECLREDEDTECAEKKSEQGETFYLRNVRVDGEGAKIVENALQYAMDQLQTKDIGEAVNRICADWLLLQEESADLSLDVWLNFLNKEFNTDYAPLTVGSIVSDRLGKIGSNTTKTSVKGAKHYDDSSLDDDELENLLL